MKYSLLRIVVASFVLSDAPALAQQLEWLRQFGSTGASNDQGLAVTTDPMGFVYVAGQTTGVLPGQVFDGTQRDLFLRKYDAEGNEIWTRQFAITGGLTTIASDATGIYLGGELVGELPGQTSAGGGDAWIIKYDADGGRIWAHQFGSPGNDIVEQVATAGGDVYLAGITTDTLPGQVRSGAFYDAFVRRMDGDGNEVWTRQFGSPDFTKGMSVSSDGSDVYVAGDVRGALPGQVPIGESDAFVRRYDGSGNLIWTRQFGTTTFDFAGAVTVAGSAVYVTGNTEGTFPGETTPGGFYVRRYASDGTVLWTRQIVTTGAGPNAAVADDSGLFISGTSTGALPGEAAFGFADAFILHHDPNGNLAWADQFGSDQMDEGKAIGLGPSGVYVAGQVGGALPGQVHAGSNDVFVRRYDGGGVEAWTRQFGGAVFTVDEGSAVAASGGMVFVVGTTNGALPGQSLLGVNNAFVRVYGASGNEVWTRQFGTGFNDWAKDVAVSATAVYVAGETSGTYAGQTQFGGIDGFIRKYDLNGAELWTLQFGTNMFDTVSGIAIDGTGIYVTGHIQNVTAEPQDGFLRKYDHDGNEIWSRLIGTSQLDSAYRVAADGSAVYVAGYTYGEMPGQTQVGFADGYLVKFDTEGTEMWVRQFGTDQADFAGPVTVDSTGVYVGGVVAEALPGQGFGGFVDAFLIKYDAAGNQIWTRQFGGPLSEAARAVTADATGVYVSGEIAEPFVTESTEVFIRKYDSAGNLLWTTQFGSPDYDAASGIAADAGAVYVAGMTNGALPGYGPGGGDAYLLKIAQDIDGDGIFGGSDCDDADLGVWAIPGEAGDLEWLGDGMTLFWPAASPSGGLASRIRYDLLRTVTPSDFGAANAVCAETDDGADLTYTEGAIPPAGTLWSYLVRAENTCGQGSAGLSSDGTQRQARSCP